MYFCYAIILARRKAGLEENLELYGLIAGLWGAVYALGYVRVLVLCMTCVLCMNVVCTLALILSCCYSLSLLLIPATKYAFQYI